MKKTLFLLIMLLPALALVSCSDDKDLPDVDFNFTFANASDVDGTIYVVQGETMEITSIDVVNNEAGKKALITAANYYWDGYYIGASVQPPYGFEIEVTEDTPLGVHVMEVECPLFAVDKEPAFALVAFKVAVVASADDIPSDAVPSVTVSPQISDASSK